MSRRFREQTGERSGREMSRARTRLDGAGRAGLVDRILWWQDRCWRGIQQPIDRGPKSVGRLKDAAAVDAVRAGYDWTFRNRRILDAALTRPRAMVSTDDAHRFRMARAASSTLSRLQSFMDRHLHVRSAEMTNWHPEVAESTPVYVARSHRPDHRAASYILRPVAHKSIGRARIGQLMGVRAARRRGCSSVVASTTWSMTSMQPITTCTSGYQGPSPSLRSTAPGAPSAHPRCRQLHLDDRRSSI
jgi:hypothetical protein